MGAGGRGSIVRSMPALTFRDRENFSIKLRKDSRLSQRNPTNTVLQRYRCANLLIFISFNICWRVHLYRVCYYVVKFTNSPLLLNKQHTNSEISCNKLRNFVCQSVSLIIPFETMANVKLTLRSLETSHIHSDTRVVSKVTSNFFFCMRTGNSRRRRVRW